MRDCCSLLSGTPKLTLHASDAVERAAILVRGTIPAPLMELIYQQAAANDAGYGIKNYLCAQCLASEVLSITRFDNGIGAGTANATGLVLAVERSGDVPPHRSARKRREPEVRHLDQLYLEFSMLRLTD